MCNFALEYKKIVEENQDFPAFVGESAEISHAEFWKLIECIASSFNYDGVTEGSIVCFYSDDFPMVLAAMLATSLCGGGFVAGGSAAARLLKGKTTHHYRTADVTASPKFKLIDENWLKKDAQFLVDNAVNSFSGSNSPWLYLSTSGTTGTAKSFWLTQEHVLTRSRVRARDFPYRKTVLATPAPALSRLFWARALGTLMQAGAIVDSYKVDVWVKSGVNLVVGSPIQVYDFFQKYPTKLKFQRAEIGGAKISDNVLDTLLNNFTLVVDSYGAAETNKSFENEIRRGKDGLIETRGVPLDSEIQILKDSGELCTAGELGTVRVRNSYMIKSYINDEKTTERIFRDGWFNTGDLATWGKNQELIIVGRNDDVINLGGHKLNAGLLDMFFSRIDGIKEAMVFQNPRSKAVSKLLILAQFDSNEIVDEVIENACFKARSELGVILSQEAFKTVDAIPRTSDGDPDRKTAQKIVNNLMQAFPIDD